MRSNRSVLLSLAAASALVGCGGPCADELGCFELTIDNVPDLVVELVVSLSVPPQGGGLNKLYRKSHVKGKSYRNRVHLGIDFGDTGYETLPPNSEIGVVGLDSSGARQGTLVEIICEPNIVGSDGFELSSEPRTATPPCSLTEFAGRCKTDLSKHCFVDPDCPDGVCVSVGTGEKQCFGPADCVSAVCGMKPGCSTGSCMVCFEPTCTDGVMNGNEKGVDCGGSCGTCECEEDKTCASFVCGGGDCVPASCADRVKNQDEEDVDCGGKCPQACAARVCTAAPDCASQQCVAGHCAAPSCADGIVDGDETDVDCGGITCGVALGQKCPANKACRRDKDCASNRCMPMKAMPLGTCLGP